MKRLVLLALVIQASSAFAIMIHWGFETDPKVVAGKRAEAIARVQTLRDDYLEERSVSRRDMLVALQSLFKICRFESDLYASPGAPAMIPSAALPFWREAVKVVESYSYYFTCDSVRAVALQPAPWDASVWENLRTDINRYLKRSSPYSTPDWAGVLRTIAARPQPEINQVPEDIQAAIHDFAVAAWDRKRLPRETDTDIWSSIAMMAEHLAGESVHINEGMDRHYEYAKERNRRALDYNAAALKLGLYAPPSFTPLFNDRAVFARDATRALGLALEAVAPGSLTTERPYAREMFFKEDLESILGARESSSCASAL